MFQLELNETRWIISTDDERAVPVISAFAKAMSLSPAPPQTRKTDTTECRIVKVTVSTDFSRPSIDHREHEPVLCHILPPDDDHVLLHNMMAIGQTIVHEENLRGNLLIHGALAESRQFPGKGILLAGPGNVGKTTASNRLAPPWHSLSDDAALVTKNSSGEYFAHPWPTWSRFFSTVEKTDHLHNQWNVEQSIPLEAIFFLSQAEEDYFTRLPRTSALAFLMETILQVSPTRNDLPADQARNTEETLLNAANALIQSVSAYTLGVSLTGSFWEQIEQALHEKQTENITTNKKTSSKSLSPSGHKQNDPATGSTDGTTQNISYSGPSMNPTLRHHDLMEVVPYRGEPAQPGDVICFRSPLDAAKVIHRVVRVDQHGIHTRGDNNSANDPYTICQDQVIGRVSAIWRNGKHLRIPGGFHGRCIGYFSIPRRRARLFCSLLLYRPYRYLSSKGIVRKHAPSSLQPKVYEFRQQHLPSVLKLFVNGDVIGRYDALTRNWIIDFPWRMLIDETRLPVASGNQLAGIPRESADKIELQRNK